MTKQEFIKRAKDKGYNNFKDCGDTIEVEIIPDKLIYKIIFNENGTIEIDYKEINP